MAKQTTDDDFGLRTRPSWSGPVLFALVAVAVAMFFWWFLGSESVQHDSADLVAERIRPIGQLRIAEVASQAGPVAQAQVNGKAIYQAACAPCHSAGVAGAPRLGDTVVWAGRIVAGIDRLYGNAINGLQGTTGVMPPRGGNSALEDAQVRAAVDYMVAQAQ
ncbi:MAG: c-type cytochrome [Arenicellales bacterium]|nr:c-type cytochrome [Arenicellales bacterium]MDP6393456.1 c-type cytochrome [Arenicellales bacterium]MDP7192528.1 c-type cytochrome [Arenicellales bacterium]MDP7523175.1 c-type cytochrome [Arenicellales bacterium]HCF73778.1 hypothetical protein [Gammaproteobacteria bacterium]